MFVPVRTTIPIFLVVLLLRRFSPFYVSGFLHQRPIHTNTNTHPRAIATRNGLTKTKTVRQCHPNAGVDLDSVFRSLVWGLDLYLGVDWMLAPFGTGWESDFNPATRTASFLGKLFSGRSLRKSFQEEITKNIVDKDGNLMEFEMGSRLGSGANVGYTTTTTTMAAADTSNTDTTTAVDTTTTPPAWLVDRDDGLRSSAPVSIQVLVILLYGFVGCLLANIFDDSLQTAAVLVIPALVYEIGRPQLPTREEALLDTQLDTAIAFFSQTWMLRYDDNDTITKEGLPPVRRDEATNERELVTAFRKRTAGVFANKQDYSDFQIEMRFRELGSARSEGGYIKGVRLLRRPRSNDGT